MADKVDDILFTMTKEMADIIIKYSNLKKEIAIDEELMKNIIPNSELFYMFYHSNLKKKKQLERLQKQFIREFKNNNQEAIEEYILISGKEESH